MADGSVIIEADVETQLVTAKLRKLKSELFNLQTKNTLALQLKGDAEARLHDLGAAIDEIDIKIQQMRADGESDTAIQEQVAAADRLAQEYGVTEKEVQRYGEQIAETNAQIKIAQREVGILNERMRELDNNAGEGKRSANGMADAFGRVGNRIKRLATRVLFFSLITLALRGLRSFLGGALKANEAFMASIAKLKGAMLTAFAPLWEAIVPWLIAFVNILTRAITILNGIVGALFGYNKTAKQSAKNMYNQAKATKAMGNAAEKASKQMAGFDEINQLNDNNGGGGAGADVGGGGIDTEFDIVGKVAEIEKKLAGFLLTIGAILAFSGVNVPLGIAMMALGAMTLAQAAGLNWENVIKFIDGNNKTIMAILGGSLLVIGAILAFSGANLPLGIGLMIAGAVALAKSANIDTEKVAKFVDKNLTTIMDIVGGALLALGVVLLVMGIIPLGIGLIIAGIAVLAVSDYQKVGDITNTIQKTLQLIMQLVGGALAAIGIVLIVSGNLPLGVACLVAGIVVFVTATAYDGGKGIKGTIQTVLATLMSIASGAMLVVGIVLLLSGIGIGLGLACIALGLNGIVTAWSISDNPITRFVKAMANKIISIANWVIDAVNKIFDIQFDGLNIAGVQVIPAFHKQLVNIPKIPMLAEGAVIPPNKKFMAMLGDQTNGNNLEAPESLIRQIVREESGNITIEFTGDLAALARILNPHIKNEQNRTGVSLVKGAT